MPQDENVVEDRQLELPVAAGGETPEGSPVEDVVSEPATPPSSPAPSESSKETGSEAPPPSWRERATEHGLDLSSYESDDDALKYLAQRSQLSQDQQALAQYGQEFVRHAADGSWQEYQDWKRQRSVPEEPKLWDPPEWNPNWLTQVKQDEAGNLVPDTGRGGTPETVARVNRYLQFRQDQQEKFWSDPYRFIQPFVEKLAVEKAKGLVQEELGRYGEQLDARHFITNNKDWLYSLNEAGQIKYRDNQPVLSDEGQVFFDALRRVDSRGWSQADKQDYAMEALQHFRELQALKGKAAPTSEARKEEQLQKAAGYTPQASGSLNQSADAEGVEPPQNSNLPFRELLMAEFKAAGMDPKDDLVAL